MRHIFEDETEMASVQASRHESIDLHCSAFTVRRSAFPARRFGARPKKSPQLTGKFVASPRTLHYAGKQMKKKPKRPATNGEQRTVNGERQWLGLKKS
jgi:hypothetical protein